MPEKTYPKNITLDATNTCNARCIFCDVLQAEPLTREKIERLLRQIRPALPHTQELAFVGWGEFLLMPGVADFLREMDRDYPDTEKKIVTNGACFTEEIIDIVTNGRYRIDISLHAATTRTHELLTGIRRFDSITRNIRTIAERRGPGNVLPRASGESGFHFHYF